MGNKIIYLDGFMAAGKSTIGPILANTLGWDFYDLDHVIEIELGKKIVDIFSDEGENYFRQKESEILLKLSKMNRVVISLGGGTSSSCGNLETISATGKVVYLKASLEALYRRLRNKRDRPIVNSMSENEGKDNLRVKISQLLLLRVPFYEKADLIVDTDTTPLGQTVDKIAKLILRDKK